MFQSSDKRGGWVGIVKQYAMIFSTALQTCKNIAYEQFPVVCKKGGEVRGIQFYDSENAIEDYMA